MLGTYPLSILASRQLILIIALLIIIDTEQNYGLGKVKMQDTLQKKVVFDSNGWCYQLTTVFQQYLCYYYFLGCKGLVSMVVVPEPTTSQLLSNYCQNS